MNRRPLFSPQSTPSTPLVLQVQPARAESARDLTGLETAMPSLALGTRSPLALEIAATTTPMISRSFLLRAENTVALAHLAAQIQSRHPQARITSVETDPLQVAPTEECSAIELLPGAASYLPLRAFRAQDLRNEGVDPLLGILAAFNHLPPQARAVVQLALLPAPPTWSNAHRRLAVEHPLEQEHRRDEERLKTHAPGVGRIVALFLLVVLLVIASRLQKILLPRWLVQAGTALAQGKMPVLSAEHAALLIGIGIVLLALLFGGAQGFSRLSARFARPIYDQRLVAEKTARPAYRVRLRLFVITPGEAWPALPQTAALTAWARLKLFIHRVQRTVNCQQRWAKRGLRGFFQANWHREQARFRGHRHRVATARTRRAQREEQLSMLVAAYAQYHLAVGGYFVPRRLSARQTRRLLVPSSRRWLKRRWWAAGLSHSGHVLSVADLAALWHLPQAHDLANLPHMEWCTTRTLLAPPILTGGQGYKLGISMHAGEAVPVFFPWSCLRQNMLAVASTGKGKSSWLLHLALALFLARTTGQLRGGLMQIDFHGDLHRQTLAGVPPELEDEVVQIDLAERARLIGLNPLDVSHGADRDKLVDNMIAIIEAIWPNSYGPRTENILEYACKTLVEANRTRVALDPLHGPDEQFTLLDVMPLVRDESFRHAILEQVHDPFIHAWWDHYFEQNDARQQHEYSSSVVTKFSKFASSHVARRILGQPRSTINFTEIIDQEKLLLISCASGEVGSDIAAFVGAVLLGLFHVALAEQARLDLAARRRFLVLIDEFQALRGVDYQTMLAELRKYGGSFALATQSLAYLDRLDRSLRATVLANIDHLFAFAMSVDDADLLHLESVEPEDMVNLPNYTCYARLSLDGARLPLFSLRLDDPIPPPPGEVHEIHAEEAQKEERWRRISLRSHLRYARPVGEIDDLLLSLQAREALMVAQTRSTGKRLQEASVSSPDSARGAQRGTRRRGSGKGKRSTNQAEAAKDESAENAPQGTPVIHDLFADTEQEEIHPEDQEERDA